MRRGTPAPRQIGRDAMVDIILNVNGRRYSLEVEARWTLADALRDGLGLTGTHVGCEHGVCGACTIIVDGDPVRSCLMYAVQADGREISTVEGLEQNGVLHPLQQIFIDHHALQCGFCTPGFLMLVIAAVNGSSMTDDEVTGLLSSNLCRCTGYENILTAVRAYVKSCEPWSRIGDEPRTSVESQSDRAL
jgi:carbon-monoxide dehydrogenase small subunit